MSCSGIDHPQQIDLITRDGDIFRLVLVEQRVLTEDNAAALQDKLNNYLGFIIDGALHTNYPESQGKTVRIRLELAMEPDSFVYEFLNLYGVAVAEYDIALEVCLNGEVII